MESKLYSLLFYFFCKFIVYSFFIGMNLVMNES